MFYLIILPLVEKHLHHNQEQMTENIKRAKTNCQLIEYTIE